MSKRIIAFIERKKYWPEWVWQCLDFPIETLEVYYVL